MSGATSGRNETSETMDWNGEDNDGEERRVEQDLVPTRRINWLAREVEIGRSVYSV